MSNKFVVHYRDVRPHKGTYVTEEYAKKHPEYTVKEHDKISKRK